jgi:hypothetical protein
MPNPIIQPPTSGNVLPFRPVSREERGRPGPKPVDPWQRLNADLVMAKARAGTLEPELVAYLLAGIGLDLGGAP